MEAFPDDGILTEESGRVGGSGERVWIIDPLDGTRAFARGEPGVCVHVALHAEGELQLGVVADPRARRVAFAVRGQGAFERDESGDRMRRLQVGSSTGGTPRLVTSRSMSLSRRDALLESCGWSKGPRVRGAGYKTLTICRGEGEVYFSEHPLHVWDTAAPVMIAREAGAFATAPSGAELRFPLRSGWRHDEGMVITAGLDHASALRSLSEGWSALEAAG
jgi:3'-phosphoadenosine 5'-phosphosulfate (PAPS) 3'-phosphatase